jgi:hypothetical protein
LSNACFQSSITRKRVDWHPNSERKAARNGLKITYQRPLPASLMTCCYWN